MKHFKSLLNHIIRVSPHDHIRNSPFRSASSEKGLGLGRCQFSSKALRSGRGNGTSEGESLRLREAGDLLEVSYRQGYCTGTCVLLPALAAC
jgi:hypothetical protein